MQIDGRLPENSSDCPCPATSQQPTAKMARSSSLLVLAACVLAFYGLQSAFVAAPGQALRGAEAIPVYRK